MFSFSLGRLTSFAGSATVIVVSWLISKEMDSGEMH